MARPVKRPVRRRRPVKIAATTATSLADLVPNPKNPRKAWSAEQLEAFRQSLAKFGDLGGIVRNLTTNQLIGGHKRIEAFHQATDVKVVTTPQPPDAQGTVAHGYVLVDGHRFAYREVQWSLEDETAANLAANRWAAEWEWQLVAEALQTINSDELRALTGFADHELANLLAADWTTPAKGELMGDTAEGDHAVHLSATQYALLVDTKAKLDPTGVISDAGAVEVLCRRILQTT
ncbi:MAG: hypothetical protein DMF89_17335 [Acidobacteria bacterium]|nr:MAG: hypothetical protein DMF89_17335 [Acidobacteriota bacterium]